jgi:ABC-2 type transport system permease protein
MNALSRSLSAEFLKTKRTLAIWMVLIAPTVVCFLQFMVLMKIAPNFGNETPIEMWRSTASNMLNIWTILAMPLFITLETALLANVEHSEKQWKHLFALALPRWSAYAAKWLVAAGLAAMSMAVLVIEVVLVGYAAQAIRPALEFSGTPPLGWMARTGGLVFLCSLLILSIHTWVALHWKSFTVAVGFGMAATVANIIIMNSDEWSRYYPWALPIQALPVSESTILPVVLAVCVVGGVVLALLGGWEVVRRDVL